MAKKKKTKWPYKFVTAGNLDEFNNMSNEDLLKEILRYDVNVKAETKNKKDSEALKEEKATINEHRKWYQESSKAFRDAEEELKLQKQARDEDIAESIENKAALEKGFNDSIKNFKEHCDVAMKILRSRQKFTKK